MLSFIYKVLLAIISETSIPTSFTRALYLQASTPRMLSTLLKLRWRVACGVWRVACGVALASAACVVYTNKWYRYCAGTKTAAPALNQRILTQKKASWNTWNTSNVFVGGCAYVGVGVVTTISTCLCGWCQKMCLLRIDKCWLHISCSHNRKL